MSPKLLHPREPLRLSFVTSRMLPLSPVKYASCSESFFSMKKVNNSNLATGVGFADLYTSFRKIRLPLYLAWADIRQRYRRSSLGPFWITISTGVMIACLGIIFGNLFETPIQEFFPFLSAGLIIWGLVSSTISESTTVFTTAEAVIRQLPLPLFTHVLRLVTRNVYIFFHNLIIYPIVLLVVQKSIGPEFILFIPGFFLLLVNLLWMSLLLGIICARFRDLVQIVQSFLQIVFYITPIIWMPGLLARRTAAMVLEPNPFYHLLEIVRGPLLGQVPTLTNWMVSAALAILGWLLTVVFFNKFRNRIAYWL